MPFWPFEFLTESSVLGIFKSIMTILTMVTLCSSKTNALSVLKFYIV